MLAGSLPDLIILSKKGKYDGNNEELQEIKQRFEQQFHREKSIKILWNKNFTNEEFHFSLLSWWFYVQFLPKKNATAIQLFMSFFFFFDSFLWFTWVKFGVIHTANVPSVIWFSSEESGGWGLDLLAIRENP